MIIATWNISSGIDMKNYQGELFDRTPDTFFDESGLTKIAEAIKKYKVDVIALQEVTTSPSFKFVEKLSKLTNLEHFEIFENSPGFLIEGTKIGLAILSKFPIKNAVKEFFNNPNLTKTTSKSTYSSHDKGFIAATICAEQNFNLICTQFLPFHRFDKDIFEFKPIFKNFQEIAKSHSSLVCGDFNVIDGKAKLVKFLNELEPTHEFVFDEITTTDSKRCDNIIVPKNIKIKSKKIITNTGISDHFLCIIEI